MAREGTHGIPGLEQLRDEPSADVTGHAGDEDKPLFAGHGASLRHPGRTRAAICDDERVSESFDAVDVIITKRDRDELSDDQIDWVIDAYTRGAVADEQMCVPRDGDPAQRDEPARDRALDRRR